MKAVFDSPFNSRYGSGKMRGVFSRYSKYSNWRWLWYKLALAEHYLGLPVTREQTEELKAHIGDIDFDLADKYEQETRHDVMAHILTLGDQCPGARPIIHLGATSCYVTDNTDIALQERAMAIIHKRLQQVIYRLKFFAGQYSSVATVGYTHLQVAQPTTVGKRACMWIQDLQMDEDQLKFQMSHIKYLGCRGATGTAASFLELFDGNAEKVRDLERVIFGDKHVFDISGQTYTRKQDYNIMHVLCGIAQSASKFANDIRFLSSQGEIIEKRTATQVGSSAMPYKTNPIQSEKINSLSRFVINNLQTFAENTATQFLERTLDDSANRRILIPEMFLAVDEILITYLAAINSLNVVESVVYSHVSSSLPKASEESSLMRAVLGGADRQDAHEVLRKGQKTVPECIADVRRLIGMAEQQTVNFLDGQQG